MLHINMNEAVHTDVWNGARHWALFISSGGRRGREQGLKLHKMHIFKIACHFMCFLMVYTHSFIPFRMDHNNVKLIFILVFLLFVHFSHFLFPGLKIANDV